MKKIHDYCEIPERPVQQDDAAIRQPERGMVTYRCKVYRALLDITLASQCRERPLVLRSGRWIDETD